MEGTDSKTYGVTHNSGTHCYSYVSKPTLACCAVAVFAQAFLETWSFRTGRERDLNIRPILEIRVHVNWLAVPQRGAGEANVHARFSWEA